MTKNTGGPGDTAPMEPAGPTTPTPTGIPAPGGAPHASAALRHHGTGVRGENLSRQSPLFEGRFGRMFRTLPAADFKTADLKALADKMTAAAEAQQTPEDQRDDEENSGISAGYTYLGQFIDHDLTFDPASSLQRQNDPDGLTDFRTPRFDLDNIYGRGPDDQPYLYANDGVRMLLGRKLTGSAHDANTRDVPRNTPNPDDPRSSPNPNKPARALLGDPRNDENVIVSQLQATMLRFHNRVADVLAPKPGARPLTFERVQREVRWHYQWVVLHDFLPTIIGKETLLDILPQLKDDGVRGGVREFKPNLRFYSWKKDPFIPVEFSVAAYRFGHSMVRPIYRLNTALPGRQFIFAPDIRGSLVGFRAFPDNWAVDWNLFFRIDPQPPALGINRLQRAYKIDTSLVNPLGNLPGSVAKDPHSLPLRNLERGQSMSLPSGQSVARAMGLLVIPDDKLRVGKATAADTSNNPLLTSVAADFADNAPLWHYILAEAQQEFVNDDTPIRLGPVGGRIVGEVFAGLLFGDSHSYLQQHPGWRPIDSFTRNSQFGMAELIMQARQAA